MKTEAEIRQLRDNFIRAAGDPKLKAQTRREADVLAGCLTFILGDIPPGVVPSEAAELMTQLPLEAARFRALTEGKT